MNVERTMEFILKQAAKTEGNFAKADVRFTKVERRLDRLERLVAQNNHLVGRLARYGVSLRSDIRRHERAIARLEEVHSETDGKLNALIDIVDKSIRRNGK
jgi:septal ring factor EnvC (AmiA/AmiB activator)